MGFDWEQHQYTRMIRDLLESEEDIVVDIVGGNQGKWLMEKRGGGRIVSPNKVEVSAECIDNCATNKKRIYWTIGGVALHELLWHLHPDAGKGRDKHGNENHNRMREYFLLKTNYKDIDLHVVGKKTNQKVNSTRFKKKTN